MKKITLADLIDLCGGDLSFEVNVYDSETESYVEVSEIVPADGRVDLNI